jgi:hypothetical protein
MTGSMAQHPDMEKGSVAESMLNTKKAGRTLTLSVPEEFHKSSLLPKGHCRDRGMLNAQKWPRGGEPPVKSKCLCCCLRLSCGPTDGDSALIDTNVYSTLTSSFSLFMDFNHGLVTHCILKAL